MYGHAVRSKLNCRVLVLFNSSTSFPFRFNISTQFAPDAESDTVAVDNIPEDWMGLDVGPRTISTFEEALAPCKTIVRETTTHVGD